MSVVKFKTNFARRIAPHNAEIPNLIESAAKLSALGLLEGQSGNLSCRTRNGFIISCANTSLAHIKEDEFAEVFNVYTPSQTQVVIANGLAEPSSESPVHWIIYRLLPNINTVFHIHDDNALKFSRELRLQVTSSFQESGTLALMKEVQKLIGSWQNLSYFLLKDHGAFVLGSSTQEALHRAEAVRNQARKLVARKERG